MTPVAFQHSNFTLAVALHVAGCPIVERQRRYSLADEKRLGITAGEAARRGLEGAFVFFHNRDDKLDRLVAAFNEDFELFKQADEAARKGEDQSIEDPPGVDSEAIAKIAHRALFIRAREQAALRDPLNSRIVERNEGGVTTRDLGEGKKVEMHPGLRMCCGAASLETRKKLNLSPL